MRLLVPQGLLGGVVEHKNHSGTNGTEGVGGETFVESSNSFVGDDASEAVRGSFVEALFRGLLGLHLEATTDGIERVSGGGGAKDGGLCRTEGREHSHEAEVILVGVEADDGIESSELNAAISDDTHDRDTESVVESADAALGDGLLDAIAEAVEITLAGSDIGGETGTGVIEGVDDGEGRGTGGTTGGEVGSEKLPELSLGVVFGEKLLDGILEGQIESLGGEITNNVSSVTTPESANALLGADTSESVANTGVSGHLAGADLGVGILCLDNQLDALDRGGGRLGDGTRSTSQGEIHQETRFFLLGHDKNLVAYCLKKGYGSVVVSCVTRKNRD